MWRAAILMLLGGMIFLAWWGYRNGREADLPAVQQPVYQGPEQEKAVALTVNVDWGEEFIPRMLEICREYDVRLTFFVTGRWAGKFPELVRRMDAAGHEIGNHGFGHLHPDQLSIAANLRDIKRAEVVIAEIIGRRTRLFAPPYGERGPAVLTAAERSGHQTILWSVDTLDWKLRDGDAVITRVVNRVHPGAIVLMHPLAATTEALPVIIRELKKDGYRFVTVSGLLALDDARNRAGEATAPRE